MGGKADSLPSDPINSTNSNDSTKDSIIEIDKTIESSRDSINTKDDQIHYRDSSNTKDNEMQYTDSSSTKDDQIHYKDSIYTKDDQIHYRDSINTKDEKIHYIDSITYEKEQKQNNILNDLKKEEVRIKVDDIRPSRPLEELLGEGNRKTRTLSIGSSNGRDRSKSIEIKSIDGPQYKSTTTSTSSPAGKLKILFYLPY